MRHVWQRRDGRQRSFAGSYETVKRAVRRAPLRAAAQVTAVTQRRFETGRGEQAQVDWGQLSVRLGGTSVKVHILLMTLRAYAEGFLRKRMPGVLAAHENAFAHFGGRCETPLYDRMRTVVIGSTVDDAGRRRAGGHDKSPIGEPGKAANVTRTQDRHASRQSHAQAPAMTMVSDVRRWCRIDG